jgi:tetrahydromethanopterin S-methyltransferase subunit C
VDAALAGLGALAAVLGAATSTTGAATSTGAVFLETFLEAAVVGALIILEAVEVFMAGIRIVKRSMESIFDPLFIFAGVKKILQ